MDRHLTFVCSGLANSVASRRFLATHDVRSRNDAPEWERLQQKIGLVRACSVFMNVPTYV
jgi:hypothetical protein